MRKSKFTLAVTFQIYVILISCNIRITDDHFPVSSSSINTSKNNGVFFGTYSQNPDYILNHKNQKYLIKEIFIEDQHRKRHNGKIELIGGKQIVILFHDTIDQGFNFDWELRSTNGMRFTRKAPNELHSSMKYNQLDSIVLNVYDISKKPETKIDYTCLLTLKEKISIDAQESQSDVPILMLPDD